MSEQRLDDQRQDEGRADQSQHGPYVDWCPLRASAHRPADDAQHGHDQREVHGGDGKRLHSLLCDNRDCHFAPFQNFDSNRPWYHDVLALLAEPLAAYPIGFAAGVSYSVWTFVDALKGVA